MNGAPLAVRKPLTMRLLKRILFSSAALILLLAGARLWWEYHSALTTLQEEFGVIEQTTAKNVTAALWDYDRDQLALYVEGIRNFSNINYAAVRDLSGVLVESGVRRRAEVLDREFPLFTMYNGKRQELGVLLVQADLKAARQKALRSALWGLGFNSALVALVAGLLFWLTNSMISRHLTKLARHLQAFSLADNSPPLVLDKQPDSDELDVLAQAVNTMQKGLGEAYAQVLAAQAEAQSQARFPEQNPNPVLRVTATGVLAMANAASQGFLEHLGCGPGQPLPQPYDMIIRAAMASGEMQRFEAEYGDRAYAFVARPILPDGYVNIYGMDITERKQATDDIKRSLQEKEILLKEIHHRVKNNLQIISSLLFLQMEYVSDPRDKELFAESQKRIQAMALVHEELYGAENLSSVDMTEYVPRLVDRVLASADILVRSELRVDEVRLPVTRSIPCGLVLNELVMNAVKHAFRPGLVSADKGLLRVSLHNHGDLLVLEVADNGPGLPPGFSLDATTTLGMTLVTGLTQQLGGSVTAYNLAPGACFRLELPCEAP